MDYLKFMMVLDIWHYLALEKMMVFTIELDLISQKVEVHVLSHYYAKVKTDFYNSLPLENTLTFCNIIILIKSVLNKDKNHY